MQPSCTYCLGVLDEGYVGGSLVLDQVGWI